METKSSRAKERVFTYRQINEAANLLAHHLLAHGCAVGDVAMIYAFRGFVDFSFRPPFVSCLLSLCLPFEVLTGE